MAFCNKPVRQINEYAIHHRKASQIAYLSGF